MAIMKKKTSSLSFVVAALIVVMAATLLLSSCNARKEKDKPAASPVSGKCFSRFFPNCTEQRCKKFCIQPLPGAVCIDKTHCCCPIA
ncbi:unnamed protein product [Triticum turgidum subsp. durum]|uniref:Defensin n=1 Tax=Triticum turgidum subsp. durum TaxID=4567 RepID=A0A9R0R9V9_TRITD|nr:unnamed protein product [Triticum turgidum subsp. durum]